MSFCKQCGADLQGANFCPVCGAPANEQAALSRQGGGVVYPSAKSLRQETLQELKQLNDCFGSKADLYLELDDVEERVSNGKRFPIVQIIMIALGIIGLIFAVKLSFGTATFSSAGVELSSGQIFLANLFTFVFSSIIPVILLIFGIRGYKKRSKKYGEEYNALLIRRDWLTNELKTNFEAYPACPISYEYTHPRILNILTSYIQSGRANTITDAVNLLHDELYKQEMLDQAAATRAAAEEAKNEARWASTASTINLFKK